MKPRLRVLSYNIHKGFDAGNRRFVLKRIRDAIRTVEADLVFLQEVQGEHRLYSQGLDGYPDIPQFEFLADSIWPHYAYGKNAVYTHGHHGNAILSRYPFSFWENIDISTNRFERRGLLHGVIDVPFLKKPLHAICIHLGLLEKERQDQVRYICDRVSSHVSSDEFLLMGGDFNDWRNKVSRPLCKSLDLKEIFHETHGTHARTYPSWFPTLRLDRIYYRGMRAENAKCMSGRPWSRLSDHTALYAELIF